MDGVLEVSGRVRVRGDLGLRSDGVGFAALIATVAQAAGFAAALLLGGALIAYAPWPTRLSFWVLAMLLAPLLVATWFLPRHTTIGMSMVWRPRLPFVPSKMRKSFATGSVAMMTAYTHGVLILSLGGQVAHDLIGSPNALEHDSFRLPHIRPR